MKQTWTIEAQDAGKRLDVFLTEQLPDVTRSNISKFLKRGSGSVNGKTVNTHHFLKIGDVVAYSDEVIRERVAAPMNADVPHLEIIDETPDYLVINKPSGLLVHPDSKQQTGTLIDALLAHDPKIAKLGDDPERPGLVHRLDREVSGLMVIPRTQDAFDNLKRQFAEHSVDKRYLALVYGEIDIDEGDLKFRIARSKTKNRMAAHPEGEKEIGKAAWTHFKTLHRYHNATLLELTILSGRTHQIRAHLLAFNHPVIGDPLYKRRVEDRRLTVPRILLQSVHLAFNDPTTGALKSYDIDPVPEFGQTTKLLKHL